MNSIRSLKPHKGLLNCAFIIVFVFVTIVSVLTIKDKEYLEKTHSFDISDGWIYEDGSDADLTKLIEGLEPFTVSRTITREEQKNGSLCFYSKNINFEVYLDGEEVYSYSPSAPKIFGNAYGVYPHHFELPMYDDSAVLSIKIFPIYDDSAKFISEIGFINGGVFVRNIVKSNLLRFILCDIITIYGIALILIGLTVDHLKERKKETIAIGTFSIVSASIITAELFILQLVNGNPMIIHFMNYMMVMLISYPGIIYVSAITGDDDSWLVRIIGSLTFINLAVQIVLTALGISDYHRMLKVTHALVILTLFFIIVLIINGIRKKRIDTGMYKYLLIAFAATSITGVYDIVNYSLTKNLKAYGKTFQFGLILFVLFIGSFEIHMVVDLTRKGRKADFMEMLAYHDVMTGLLNRQGYVKERERLQREKEGISTFVMFDVNNLKQMNDNYGHDLGDELIKTAAKIIDDTFGKIGKTFRMGGDEFFVITEHSCYEKTFTAMCDEFESTIDRYNSNSNLPLTLSIAYGFYEYRAGIDDPEEIEHLADNRMYEMKVNMKERSRKL